MKLSLLKSLSPLGGGGAQSWTGTWYTLKSGSTWYRREINNSSGYFKLYYSSDAGVTWEELMNLDLTEASVIIDLTHQYTHSIIGTAYVVKDGSEILYST